MEYLFSKRTESDLKKLGLYQIIGGVVGIVIVLWGILKMPLLLSLTLLLYLLILVFYSYSILCGILCIKKSKYALSLSLVNQLLQVIGFAFMGLALEYVAGLYLTLGLDLTGSFSFSLGVGISKFKFNFNNEVETLEVGFNLIAFALIYWIDKLMRETKEEIVRQQVTSIGDS